MLLWFNGHICFYVRVCIHVFIYACLYTYKPDEGWYSRQINLQVYQQFGVIIMNVSVYL